MSPTDTHEQLEIADHETRRSTIGSHGNEVGQMLEMHEMENPTSALVPPSQPMRAFCPSENKRFYCGIAKKLGCQFCASK
jgi:hypothetical protein